MSEKNKKGVRAPKPRTGSTQPVIGRAANRGRQGASRGRRSTSGPKGTAEKTPRGGSVPSPISEKNLGDAATRSDSEGTDKTQAGNDDWAVQHVNTQEELKKDDSSETVTTGDTEALESSEQTTEQLPSDPCRPCEREGRQIAAVSFCRDCEDDICTTCAQQHRKFPGMKDHVIMDLSEKHVRTVIMEMCVKHAGKVLDMFCFDHDVVPCSACIAIDHRKCQNVAFLPELAYNVRETDEYKDVYNKVKHLARLTEERDHMTRVKRLSAHINDTLDRLESKTFEVTILVFIFTAKEHNENSYTKSEKNNKSIILLMKGLWTQIILVAVAWSFAFISLKMNDRIIKYIFGLFNSLQGMFFLVFYLLLNEEVRNIFKVKAKKKTLTAHGFDDVDDQSLDSQPSSQLIEKDRVETLVLDPRPRRRRDQATRHKKRSKRKQDTSNVDDDRMASDCEMITSL